MYIKYIGVYVCRVRDIIMLWALLINPLHEFNYKLEREW